MYPNCIKSIHVYILREPFMSKQVSHLCGPATNLLPLSTGTKTGRSFLIEDGALQWIVQNANNEASPIRRHIELALCHLAQHGKWTSTFLLRKPKFSGNMFLKTTLNLLICRSECKGHDQWGCPLGASSYLTGLFSGGYQKSCSSDSNFQPHLPI